MLSGMEQRTRGDYMSKLSRADYFRVMGKKYRKVNKKRKGVILDDACSLTGLNRRVVAHKLHNAWRKPLVKLESRGRPVHYSDETKQAVIKLWHAANDIAAERLHPFIPDLLDKLLLFGLVVSPEAEASYGISAWQR